MAQVSWMQKRFGSTKQICALHARLNHALRRSKREPPTLKTSSPRLKRMRNGCRANWKSWLLFPTPHVVVRRQRRQLLTRLSPVSMQPTSASRLSTTTQPQETAAVNFRSGSAVLSTDSKTTLDDIASKALNAKGYVLEVSGFADSRGSINLNRQLSQRRADAVIRYLVENHNIPLRRIVTPYGYGEMNPVAENEIA